MSNWLLAVSADIALPPFKIVSSIDHVEGIWWISVIYRDFWKQIEALDNELRDTESRGTRCSNAIL